MQPDTMQADIMKAENMRISRITVWQMDLPLGQPYFCPVAGCGSTGWTAPSSGSTPTRG